jgi:hypothetical protein
MTVKIAMNDSRQPGRKLADAELRFTDAPMAGR